MPCITCVVCACALCAAVFHPLMAAGGVRLHYGHPDVFNRLVVLTRVRWCMHFSVPAHGGIPHRMYVRPRHPGSCMCTHPRPTSYCPAAQGGMSKATRALHVSEDVFAGLAHMGRGGRIVQCEHSVVGKVSTL